MPGPPGYDEVGHVLADAAGILHGPIEVRDKLEWAAGVARWAAGSTFAAYFDLVDGRLVPLVELGDAFPLWPRASLAAELVTVAARRSTRGLDAGQGALAFPVGGYNQTVHGTLLIGAPSAERYDGQAEVFLVSLAAHLGVALDNQAAMAQLAEIGAMQSEVVHRLQEAVRPPVPIVPGAEMGVFYLPSEPEEPTGGDLYDWLLLPDGDLHIVVVDVMGKGVAATKDALVVTHAARLLVLEGCPLVEVAARTNALIGAQSPDLVATMLVARYTPVSGRLRMAGAGHPPLMVVTADGRCRQVDAPGIPVGWPGAGSVGEVEVVLDRQDTAVFYTDGLIEADKDVILGLAALERAAIETMRYPAEHLARALVERALAGAVRRDDTLALVLRRRMPPPGAGGSRLGRFEHRFSPIAAAVPLARHLLEDWIRLQPVEAGDRADLLVAASELCANAVRTASGLPGSVTLRAWADGDAIVIEVEDDGSAVFFDGVVDAELPEPMAERGRGLYLVRALSDELTVRRERDATVVRCVKRAVIAEPSS